MASRRRRHNGFGGFRPYVPVAQRRRQAALEVDRARSRGETLDPVVIEGRRIATTPWGRAWCEHVESFGDFADRLPRGRTYARNGSVLHLAIERGAIRSQVMGSELYEQRVEIEPCKPAAWKRIRRRCAGGIGSLIELLEGRIASEVMAAMTAERGGLMPDLKHVRMGCTCPDWAWLCKHLAAVLYGVGARLDKRPELLFHLRGVDPAELVDDAALRSHTTQSPAALRTVAGDLSSVFGIELDEEAAPNPPAAPRRKPARTVTSGQRRVTRKRKVRRRELLDAGVPAGTISSWLRQGVLKAGAERGTYLHTRESRERLQRYAG